MYQIEDYQAADGRLPFKDWLSALADRQAKARVLTRVQRMAAGNLGDCKPIQDGLWELRIDYGPGYRVYYAQAGAKLLLLLIGGDKRKQQGDIDKAVAYWKDWKQRTDHE
ncbi:type II toxin-antitoxin system RelE/ParE family toxin [Methylomonas sp. MO1]|uniref:type II toxin-antitoxin system RelE/ParE family toxin n=1 Tax=Methylomonas sp. MO1 TaxID=3073619 RepID=UPI0028A43776|nr:type II toxin-antitoxin system RelE/ParE family toxin [Methylomonas sp. MO1]MDT4291778.1 type II toxin-antitoxin system RelE/ParE family toxin [Methylomonas sp. MO1]